MSKRAPAPKNIPGSLERAAPAAAVVPSAAMLVPTARRIGHRAPGSAPTGPDSAAPSDNSSLVGRFACWRSTSHSVAEATKRLDPTPVANVAAVMWNPRPAPFTASRQSVDNPQSTPLA